MYQEQIQTERIFQEEQSHFASRQIQIRNYKLQLQLLLLSISNFSYYYFNESQKTFTLIKFLLTLVLAIATFIFVNSLKPMLCKLIKFTSELLSLSQLVLCDEFNSFAIILVILNESLFFFKNDKKIIYHFDSLLLKIVLLIYISLFWQNIVIILISINSLVLEFYRVYCVISQEEKQKIENSIQIEKVLTQGLIIKENLWKRRLQSIPLSIIILNKKSLSIEFKNETANQHFNTRCYDKDELNQLIMTKLEFTLVQDNLEMLRNSSSYIIRKNFQVKQTALQTCQLDPEVFNKTNLQIITQNFINGKYKNLINSKYNTLELYCQQVLDQQLFQLTGTIFSSDDDEDLTIVLSDISKQVQLQSFIQKDEFQQKIIESFSHELKTPLNSTMNFLKAALSNAQLPLYIKETCIEPATVALQLQSYVINDVIDFTQFYANSLELEIRQFEIGDLINEITNIFSIQFMQKGLEFIVDLSQNNLELISTDYNRLMQVLVNIIQNSLKFTFQGYTILKIKTVEENQIQFSISDTGIGIDSERIKQQNQYLCSVENLRHFSHLKSWEGFGLLISSIILNKLNSGMQGAFQIKSQQNKGTKFKFLIRQLYEDETFQPSQFQMKRNSFQSHKKSKYQYSNHVISSAQLGAQIQNQNLRSTSKIQSFIVSPQLNEQDLCSNSSSNKLCEKLRGLSENQHSFILDIKKKSNSSFEQRSCKSSVISKRYNFDQIKNFESQANETTLQNFVKKIQCGCRRIMSIDDEIFNQNSIKMLISRYGFDVVTAFNGREAIQKIQQLIKCSANCVLLNLIIMDYSMPIMGGIECTIQLNKMMQQQLLPQIPIVGLTAFTSKEDIQSCLTAGMVDVLSKPLKLKDFCEIINLL